MSGSDARLWPEDASAIGDYVPSFQIAYLGPEWADLGRDETEVRARQWIEMRGSTRRQYKNGLALALPTAARLDEARQHMRMLLAVEALISARSRYNLSVDQLEELRDREKRLAGDILASLRRLYDIVALPIEATGSPDPLGIEWIDLRAQPLSSEKIQERVLEALRHWVFDRVTPVKLVGLTRLGQDSTTQMLSCATLVGYCFSFLNFPKLLGNEPIRAAIAQGVRDGVLGYSAALQQKASGQPFVTDHRLMKIDTPLAQQEIDVSATSYLVAPELARRLSQPPQQVQPDPVVDQPPSGPEKGVKEQAATYTTEIEPTKPPTKAQATSGRRYRLRFTTNKQQLFRAFRPLQNLAEMSGTLDVTLEIIARSDTPLDSSWLRNAVEEPLDEADVSFDRSLED